MGSSIQKFEYAATGNQSAKSMLDANSNGGPHTSGILTDVEVDLGTATSIDVAISDGEGVVFTQATIVADGKYKIDNAAIVRNAVIGPLTVTTTNISNAAHTATIKAWVKVSR